MFGARRKKKWQSFQGFYCRLFTILIFIAIENRATSQVVLTDNQSRSSVGSGRAPTTIQCPVLRFRLLTICLVLVKVCRSQWNISSSSSSSLTISSVPFLPSVISKAFRKWSWSAGWCSPPCDLQGWLPTHNCKSLLHVCEPLEKQRERSRHVHCDEDVGPIRKNTSIQHPSIIQPSIHHPSQIWFQKDLHPDPSRPPWCTRPSGRCSRPWCSRLQSFWRCGWRDDEHWRNVQSWRINNKIILDPRFGERLYNRRRRRQKPDQESGLIPFMLR